MYQLRSLQVKVCAACKNQMTMLGFGVVNVIWDLHWPIQGFPSDYSCSSVELMVLLFPARAYHS